MTKYLTYLFGLLGIFLFFATYGGLTTTPKFWHDEAVPFEIARNIAEFGKADLAMAPNMFWEKSYMTHATGFPLTFPLAGIFKIFGVGVMQSRLFMIAWMLGTLAALFFVMRAFFDARTAFFNVLLTATFSSFYANGRTGTGEILGFLFLLFALYFLYQKQWYGWGGFFAALAAVTKPSMYLLVFPAIALELLISKRETFRKDILNDFAEQLKKNERFVEKFNCLSFSPKARASFEFFVKQNVKIFKIAKHLVRNIFSESLCSIIMGALSVLLFWLWLINPAPFSIASWQEMIAFYQNAFNAPSLLSQFPTIIPKLLTHSTIIYFVLLFIPIFIAWRKNLFSLAQNRLIMFLFFYGALSFFYFLRSPGWFRYLLGTELLILALLPAALGKTLKILNYEITKMARMISAVLLAIALLQSAQYLLDAEIPSNTKSIEIAQFINEEILANDLAAIIGIVDFAPVAALIPADRKYQRVAVGGYDTFVGQHPLSLPPDQLPTHFVSTNSKKNKGYEYVLQTFYQPYREAPHDVLIYKKISTDQSD